MKVPAKLFAIILLSFSSVTSVLGGGTSEQVIVESVEAEGSQFSIRLRPEEVTSLEKFKGCYEIVVVGSYNSLYSWWNFPRRYTHVDHVKAVSHLKEVSGLSKRILFGEIGQGLCSMSDKKCHFVSKGLWLKTGEEQLVVYSMCESIR